MRQVLVPVASRDVTALDRVGLLRVDPSQHALDPVPLGDSSRVELA